MGRVMTHRMSAWGQVFHVLSQECGDLGLGCSEGCGSGPCPSLDFNLLMRFPHPLCQREEELGQGSGNGNSASVPSLSLELGLQPDTR